MTIAVNSAVTGDFNPAAPGALGGTTAAAGAFTTLTTSGGIGIGIAAAASVGLRMTPSLSGATTEYGQYLGPTFDASSTSAGRGLYVTTATAAASFTQVNHYGVQIETPSIGAASAITNIYGLKIENIAGGGTLNRAIHTGAGTVLLGDLAGTGSRTVLADANGLLTAPVSDETWKENMRPIPYGLATVMALRPLIFNYKDRSRFGNQRYLGFGSRATAKILPEVTGQDHSGTYYLTDEKLTAVLVRAVQQLTVALGVTIAAVLWLVAR